MLLFFSVLTCVATEECWTLVRHDVGCADLCFVLDSTVLPIEKQSPTCGPIFRFRFPTSACKAREEVGCTFHRYRLYRLHIVQRGSRNV